MSKKVKQLKRNISNISTDELIEMRNELHELSISNSETKAIGFGLLWGGLILSVFVIGIPITIIEVIMLFSPTGHLRIKKQIKIINKELRKRGYKVVVTTNKLSVIKDRY